MYCGDVARTQNPETVEAGNLDSGGRVRKDGVVVLILLGTRLSIYTHTRDSLGKVAKQAPRGTPTRTRDFRDTTGLPISCDP